jgi:hypothetical protein
VWGIIYTWSTACHGQRGRHGTDTVEQHDDIPREHAMTLSVDGCTKVSEGSIIARCVGVDARPQIPVDEDVKATSVPASSQVFFFRRGPIG